MPIGNAICRIGSCLSVRTRTPLNLGRQISFLKASVDRQKLQALLKIYHLHLGIKFIVSKSNRNICPLFHQRPFINRQTFIYGPAVTIAFGGNHMGSSREPSQGAEANTIFNYDIIEFQYCPQDRYLMHHIRAISVAY